MGKRLFAIIPILFTALVVSGCSENYTPTQGGVIDTLHNEVHVKDYATLIAGGFEHEKDSTKTYFTDDDGLKYKWNGTEYYLISETDTTINFFFDNVQTTQTVGYSQIDCPIFTIKWYMMKPLGKCPEEVDSVEKVLALGAERGFAPYYNFTHFVGFSVYPTCLGDSAYLWNFQKDIRQQAVTNLYGIWVD